MRSPRGGPTWGALTTPSPAIAPPSPVMARCWTNWASRLSSTLGCAWAREQEPWPPCRWCDSRREPSTRWRHSRSGGCERAARRSRAAHPRPGWHRPVRSRELHPLAASRRGGDWLGCCRRVRTPGRGVAGSGRGRLGRDARNRHHWRPARGRAGRHCRRFRRWRRPGGDSANPEGPNPWHLWGDRLGPQHRLAGSGAGRPPGDHRSARLCLPFMHLAAVERWV